MLQTASALQNISKSLYIVSKLVRKENFKLKQYKISNSDVERIKVFGICTPEQGYRICWEINHNLKFHFKNIESHAVYDEQDQQQEFTLYKSETEEELDYYLLDNKSGNEILNKKMSVIDFFFIAKGEISEEELEEIRQKVNDLPIIQTTIKIDITTLKDNHKFLVEE